MCSPFRTHGLLYIPACMPDIPIMWQPVGSGPGGTSCSSQADPTTLPPAPSQAAHALRPMPAQQVPLMLQANR